MTLEPNLPNFKNLGQESSAGEVAKDASHPEVRSKWALLSASQPKPGDIIDAAELPTISAADLAALFPSESQGARVPENAAESTSPASSADEISSPVASQTELIHATDVPFISAADLAALFPSEAQPQDALVPETVMETPSAASAIEETPSPVDNSAELIHAAELPSVSAADLEALFHPETHSEELRARESAAEFTSTPGALEETGSSALAQEELIHAAELPPVSPTELEALFSPGTHAADRGERRRRRRVRISMPVRLRGIDATVSGVGEITTTADVSRTGFLFHTTSAAYSLGMILKVTFPYSAAPDAIQAEQQARVVRISHIAYAERVVAIALDESGKGDLVDSGGQQLIQATPQAQAVAPAKREPEPDKPLVLALHEDKNERDLVTSYLSGEGYQVIAVGTVGEALQVLDKHTPALVISDIEGHDMPGYELCNHVKATPRLSKIPVMLITNAAYPSDYASAHTLGAVVCMAKPYRSERLGNVVRLLAPPQKSKTSSPRTQSAEPPSTTFYDRGRTSRKHPRRNDTQ
jgi:CheY-like chemotaxis protein